jgi:plasmid stabilization system protein ParE
VTYQLLVEPRAANDLDDAYRRIARQSVEHAEAWMSGALAAIQTLTELPRRCPLAPEHDAFEAEIRQLLYEGFGILVTIDGDVVQVHHVRRGTRRRMAPYEQG